MSDDVRNEPSLHGNSDYSPEVTKMLKGWKDGPVWGAGRNKVLEWENIQPEDDGREEITWKILRDRHGYEKPGKGLKLTGDISQRDKNNWQYQKHVKVRDSDGTEHAVFFYVDEPSTWDYEEMTVGSVMTINSPRLHRFMDGQDGMRLDEERMVGRLTHCPLTDRKRIDYAILMRENGNRKYKEEKYEDAVEFYESAVNHIAGTSFHGNEHLKPEAREIEVKCHNNIAQSAFQLKNYTGAIDHCHKALAINSNSAKAYYRLGLAHAARGNDKEAAGHYATALDLAPQDPSVSVAAIKKEIGKSSVEKKSQKSALKGMYSGFLGGEKTFGVAKGMSALSGGVLSRIDLFNFRDLTGSKHVFGRRLQKNILYRSSAVSAASAADLTALTNEYGIKTVVDMRHNFEIAEGAKLANKRFAEEFSAIRVAEHPTEYQCTETALGTTSLADAKKGRTVYQINILDPLFEDTLTNQERLVNSGLRAMCQGEKAVSHRLLCTQGRMTEAELLRKVLDERGVELMHIIRIVADPANHPVILSCHHGKGLTGLVALLILGGLGVDEDAIVDDFMLSLTEIPDDARKSLSGALARCGLPISLSFTLHETVLELLEFLDGRYNGIAGYLQYQGFSDEEQLSLQKVFLRD